MDKTDSEKNVQYGRSGHRQRMRESYLASGTEHMADHQILELYLSLVIPRHDVKETAYNLMNTFGSLEGVFNAEVTDLKEVKGIGENTAILISLLKEKPIFVAMKNKFLKEYPVLSNCQIYDYSAKEEFAVANALLTAEGAVNIAMNEYEGTIFGSKCLVCGFGRIGKMLAKMLKSLNADVTVSARNEVDFAYIDALGCKHINTNSLKSVKGYDLVFNTIPVMIFDGNLLMNTARNTIIIDLASLPGGVDFEAAKRYKTDAVRALSLPGRTAPKAAGEIIRKTIFNIIKEVYR